MVWLLRLFIALYAQDRKLKNPCNSGYSGQLHPLLTIADRRHAMLPGSKKKVRTPKLFRSADLVFKKRC